MRVLAATNEALSDKIKTGNFREDLYYRLAVIPIEMPALRERLDDIPLLVQHFLREELRADGYRAEEDRPESARRAAALPLARQRARAGKRHRARLRPLRRRHHPRAGSAAAGRPPGQRAHRRKRRGTLPVGQSLDEYIREQERRYIEETIKFNGGSREKAAKMLGISMATLYRKLEVRRTAEAGALRN